MSTLKAADIFLYRLLSYSPALSDIEPIWQEVKHHEMPIRSDTEIAELKRAVEEAIAKKAQALLST